MNKRFGYFAAASLIGLVAMSGTAHADTTTTNLSVTATVTPNCTASTTPVAFGAVDVLSGANVDAAGGLTVTCTNGTAWAADAGVGTGAGATLASRKMTSGSDLLNYVLYSDATRTTVWGDGTGGTAAISNTGTGAAQNVPVYGRVPLGQSSVAVGNYADTVIVTITY